MYTPVFHTQLYITILHVCSNLVYFEVVLEPEEGLLRDEIYAALFGFD